MVCCSECFSDRELKAAIGTFKIKKNVQVIDLSSIIHNSPFYGRTDKINFMINEKHLREIDHDLALFDPSVCEMVDRQSYVIDNLDYKLDVL